MSGLLFLLSCAPSLSLLLLLPGCISVGVAEQQYATPSPFIIATQSDFTDTVSSPAAVTSDHYNKFITLHTTKTPLAGTTTTRPTTTTTTTTTTRTTATIPPTAKLYWKECPQLLLVAGGLTVACFILLMSTLLLACRVCRLTRLLKAAGANDELISSSEYRMVSAKKNQSKSETEAKETVELMSDLNQTQDETKDGAAKEDGEKANEDGKKEEKKEAGEIAPSGEKSESKKPEEEKEKEKEKEKEGSSLPANNVAASPSEGTEQAKNGL